MEDQEPPVAAPRAERRRNEAAAHGTAPERAEVMYVREYDRGREVRTAALQGPETAMLASLVGETQVVTKRKVCPPAYAMYAPARLSRKW